MIDYETESVISICEAAKLLPGRPSVNQLSRWHTVGLRGTRLETLRIGKKRFTSREALQRFVAAINDQPARNLT